jgi:hypothetical protein
MICRFLPGSPSLPGAGWWVGRVAQLVGDVPGQQLVDAVNFVVCNVGEHVSQIRAWIDAVKFAPPC